MLLRAESASEKYPTCHLVHSEKLLSSLAYNQAILIHTISLDGLFLTISEKLLLSNQSL
ncbi:hypothetical protein [Wolbachia endosymbiont of Drosophila simulans]|uniref:hypothetical protein n=1 Tax=Wolbachia endosymbiont of Drosophila simulans TaxID=77038 RepID=UPI00142EA48D|nr:hypothetical protein [Wolbachia endosymbiont of Drosophila simulans]